MPSEFVSTDPATLERRITRLLTSAKDAQGRPLFPDITTPGTPGFNLRALLLQLQTTFAQQLNSTLSGFSPLTASSTQLDEWANHFGQPRKTSRPATGNAIITSSATGATLQRLYGRQTIPQGTTLTSGAVRLRTTSDARIADEGRSVVVAVEADVTGPGVKLSSGTNLNINIGGGLQSVLRAETQTDISGGAYRESDDELRFRLIRALISPSSHEGFKTRLLNHVDVSEVEIIDNAYGPGTVEAFVTPAKALPPAGLRDSLESLWQGRGGAYVVFPEFEALVFRIRISGAAEASTVVDFVNNTQMGASLIIEQLESGLITAGAGDAQVIGLKRGRKKRGRNPGFHLIDGINGNFCDVLHH